MKYGINPSIEYINSDTTTGIIKFLHKNSIDFIDHYIILLLRFRKKHFITEIVKYLKENNDFYNRTNIVDLLKSKPIYQYLVQDTN